ncbi:MAG: glycosyltransferase [Nitriliruptoraceae bacterium]
MTPAPAAGHAGEDAPLRVLVVTTVHTPLDARIHHRQIRALRHAGVAVTYAAPWRARHVDPSRVIPGVEVVDLPRSAGRRRLRALGAARALLRRRGGDHDLVLLHDPELVLATFGLLDRLPPVVLDVHEDLAASLEDRSWLPRPLLPIVRRAATWLERSAADRLAGLLLAERSYTERFGAQHPVVPNLPWLPAASPPAGSQHRVVYVGRLSSGRGTPELLRMARLLAAEPDSPRVELVGQADADVEPAVRRAQQEGVVHWHGYLPNEEAMGIVAGSLAGLAPLRDLANYRRSMPTKVVEYLAAGVPAIVTPLPEAVRVITDSGAGVVVGFEDPDALVAAVRRFAADPAGTRHLGERGREYVRAHHSWDAVTPGFVAHLHAVAGRAPR